MKPFAVLFCLFAVGIVAFVVMKAGEAEVHPDILQKLPEEDNIDASVSRVNQWLRQRWSDESLEPTGLADDLTVYRRLSLALHGTIPSLEEITAFNADSPNQRIERWLLKMLADKRFPDYFSTRLARVLTGVEEGQFVIFRRDRLRAWLNHQLANDRPWHDMTQQLIAGDGLWTSEGFANFITGAFVNEEGIDENKLAGRTVRAFLGQRIDCAQCHNHPFDSWKQSDFEGLAAFFGQVRVTPGGVIDRPIEDKQPVEYVVKDPGAEEGRVVAPTVPFHSEWMPVNGSRRQRLAAWVTHPENRRFERAIANRIWGLMFGRPWHDPVDDIGHPDDSDNSQDLLDVLGKEFRNHNGSLHFLIRLIAQSDAFRLKSQISGNADQQNQMAMHWAVFPLVRLRPEQMIGSMFQAGNVKTIDQNSNLFVRFTRFNNENDFLKEYGDAADDELLQQSGTIPQALLRMNGKFTRSLTETGPFSAAGQILRFSSEDEAVVRNCFLACLSRLPTPAEQSHFVDQLTGISGEEGDDTVNHRTPAEVVRDLYWVLFNSPGFSWNR